MSKLTRWAFACAFLIGAATVSSAAMATAHSEVQASAILIQSYGGTAPTLFYAGSSCSGGHLDLDPSADGLERQKLLWASVLSAKATGAKMNFDYDVAGDICYIRFFAVMPN